MATNGWASIGSALAGNPAREAALYDQGATGVARLEGLLSEARRRRDTEAGYAGITPDAISSAQADPSQAASLVAAMFHAGINPTQLSGYNREALGTTIQQDAYDRVRGGAAVADVNPLLAVFNGKPVEVSKVQGDVAFNPYATPDENTFDPTQIGLAEIMQKGAQADASRAAATNSYAHAAKARSDIGSSASPSPGDGGGFGRPPSGYRFDANGNLQPIPGGPADKRPTGGGQRAPNNEQSNAAGFANRMVAAGKELSALEESGYDPTSVIDRSSSAIGGVIGNTIISAQGQRYNQASQNWVRANLRKESGAAIGKDEMENEIANYFPVAGDTPQTIAQKAANRQIVEQNMIRTAGPAWRGTGDTASASPASNVAPGGSGGNEHRVGDVITVGGKQYRVVGGDPSDPEVEPL